MPVGEGVDFAGGGSPNFLRAAASSVGDSDARRREFPASNWQRLNCAGARAVFRTLHFKKGKNVFLRREDEFIKVSKFQQTGITKTSV